MATIEITDNASVDITASSADANASINRYLRNALKFGAPAAFATAAAEPIGKLDPSAFPISLSTTSAAEFDLHETLVTVQAGASGAVDILEREKKADFAAALDLPETFAPDALVSFAVTGKLTFGAALIGGNSALGGAAGAAVTLASYTPATFSETLGAATRGAAAALTIPRDVTDLGAIPPGHACQVSTRGSVQFSAELAYSFLNDPLASVSIARLPPIPILATAGATVSARVTHTGEHTITIARISKNILRLGLGIRETGDLEAGIAISAGLAAETGNDDALAFLLSKISRKPVAEWSAIRAELPEKAAELNERIRRAIEDAASSSLTASITAALGLTRSRSRIFLYEIDLAVLDKSGEAALTTALGGDFTPITRKDGRFPGIAELDSALTAGSGVTHSLGIHLLGIFNYQSTHEFLKRASVDFTADKRNIVLSDERTEIAQNRLSPEMLREIIIKDATLTLPASANTSDSGAAMSIAFFEHKAAPDAATFRRFLNVLKAVRFPQAADAAALLSGKSFGVCSLYLALALTGDLCRQLFLNPAGNPFPASFYLDNFRLAEQTILAGAADEIGFIRLQLFNLGPTAWAALREAGSRQNRMLVLKRTGFTESEAAALITDTVTAVWWSNAMAAYAEALYAGKSLVDVGGRVLRTETVGSDDPWLALAVWRILGEGPAIQAHFTSTRLIQRI